MPPRVLLASLLLVAAGPLAAQPTVELVVFRVDYRTLQPERFYAFKQPYHGVDVPYAAPPDRYHEVAGLYYRVWPPLDFGYTDVFGRFTGRRVMKAETIWGGGGRFLSPPDSLASTDFGAPGPPVAADTVAVVLQHGHLGSTADSARAAWAAVATTAPARALAAHGPVEVVVFDHFYAISPAHFGSAEWLIVAYARPPGLRDLAVLDLRWPGGLVTDGRPFEPEAFIRNFGAAADAGTLVVEVDGAVVHAEPVALAAGAAATVRLPPLTLTGPATVAVRVEAGPGSADADPANDARTQAIETTALPVFRPVASRRYGGAIPLDYYGAVPLDYDGDGDTDLLRGAWSYARLWAQQPDGTFADVTAAAGLAAVPFGHRFALADDFTGDGLPDLVFIYDGQPVRFFRNTGGQYVDASASSGLANHTGGRAASGDLDGDGDPDLLLGRSPGGVHHFTNADGAFSLAGVLPGTGGAQDYDAADLDGDGDLDVVVSIWQAPAAVFANGGAGTFTPRPGPWPGGSNREVLPFDADTDGDLDLLFARNDGSRLLRNDGTFQFSAVSAPALEAPAFTVDAGDFDGDGRTDVVTDAGGVSLLRNTPVGFEDQTRLLVRLDSVAVGVVYGQSPRFFDLDGDGAPDVHSTFAHFRNEGARSGSPNAPGPAPGARALEPPYPNPAGRAATVAFRLARGGPVALRVFDALGREVATLLEAWRPAGEGAVEFSTIGLPGGVYFVRLEAEGFVETRSVTVLH